MAEKVTIFDVAERAGVAISSVSAALNNGSGVSEATRRRILRVADELGFEPSTRARGLSGRRAYALGLVVQRDPDVLELDPFFGGFLGGIEEAIDPRGYALVLQMGSGQQATLDRYRRLARGSRVDGVLLSDLTTDDPRTDLVRELHLPAVGVNPDPDFPLPAVRQDHRVAIADMIEFLVERGHRRIGHLAGTTPLVHARQRQAAWQTALESHRISPGPIFDGGFTYAGGVRGAASLLRLSDPPTAVFCANDLSALGFIAEAQQMGFDVPGDVAVAGYDGIELGKYTTPKLATIITSPRELGRSAATLLLDLIESGEANDVSVPAATLDLRVPRSSV